MAGVNKVILVGYLGADPEVRRLNNGNPVVNMSLATTENWRDRESGEPRERTEWHRITIFNETLCRVAEQYLHKGSQIYIEGQIQTRKWTDNSGQERYTTEIVLQNYRSELRMLDRRGESGGGGGDRGGDYGDRGGSGGGGDRGGDRGGSGGGSGGGGDRGGSGGGSGGGDRGGSGGGGRDFEGSDLDDEIPF